MATSKPSKTEYKLNQADLDAYAAIKFGDSLDEFTRELKAYRREAKKTGELCNMLIREAMRMQKGITKKIEAVDKEVMKDESNGTPINK